jgi:hypothetical protein
LLLGVHVHAIFGDRLTYHLEQLDISVVSCHTFKKNTSSIFLIDILIYKLSDEDVSLAFFYLILMRSSDIDVLTGPITGENRRQLATCTVQ